MHYIFMMIFPEDTSQFTFIETKRTRRVHAGGLRNAPWPFTILHDGSPLRHRATGDGYPW